MSGTEEMEELRGYVEDGLLSKIQVEILEAKLKGGDTRNVRNFTICPVPSPSPTASAGLRWAYGRDFQKEDLRVSLAQIDRDLRRSRIEHGIPLTETSEILASINDQKLYRLFSISSLT